MSAKFPGGGGAGPFSARSLYIFVKAILYQNVMFGQGGKACPKTDKRAQLYYL